MPNINDISKFINDLFIPLAVANPTSVPSQATPNNNAVLTNFITQTERRILINSLGLTLYNELQTALADLPNADQKWQDLVNGVEYDGKVWEGLNTGSNLLLYATYYAMLANNSNGFYMAMGTERPNAENSTHTTPQYKLATAWQTFIDKYQRGAQICPNIYDGDNYVFVDWFGQSDDVDVSLYQYLVDKKDDFTWSPDLFRLYETQNSFGI